MKGCRCVCISLRGWRLRQGRPRLSTVPNLYENRLRDEHFISVVCDARYVEVLRLCNLFTNTLDSSFFLLSTIQRH